MNNVKNMKKDKTIDEAGKETFPSSDPPAWTLGTTRAAHAATYADARDVSEILAYEHHVIRKVIDVIIYAIKIMQAGKPINMTLFKDVVLFLHEFVDECHHKKEEILFPLLRHGENHPTDYVLNDLKHEHDTGNYMLNSLQAIITAQEQTGTVSNDALIDLLQDLQDLHHNHLAKEDEYIIPAINKILKKEQQDQLLEEFAKIDQHLAPKSHEQLIQMADDLLELTEK